MKRDKTENKCKMRVQKLRKKDRQKNNVDILESSRSKLALHLSFPQLLKIKCNSRLLTKTLRRLTHLSVKKQKEASRL